jgi:hypothetical protein
MAITQMGKVVSKNVQIRLDFGYFSIIAYFYVIMIILEKKLKKMSIFGYFNFRVFIHKMAIFGKQRDQN